MNVQTDARAHWRAQIEGLTARIVTAEDAVTAARDAANAAALEGANLTAATRDLAHARDVVDTLRAALGEAQRHLAEAEQVSAKRDKASALVRAQQIARKRIEVADHLDAFAREMDPALAAWVAASSTLAREMTAAGLRPINADGRDYRLRAALWATAPALMTAIDAPRVSAAHRETLRQISAAQAAPILAKGD